jgi:hypothetical protein
LLGGINTYAYVCGNPLGALDPFGLTQCDIDAAYAVATRDNPDMKFGAGPPKVDIPDAPGANLAESQLINQGTQTNIPGRDGYIHLNQLYLGTLNQATVADLLDTIIHEGLHFTRPPQFQDPAYNFDHPYIYPEAARRTQADMQDYLNQRAACGCRP